ncbi:MAG: hydrogenase 4 subunit B [Acidobacteria bacterium]|nr:hydrogenase 4 subunit B [Acidobacteriota bacterium]
MDIALVSLALSLLGALAALILKGQARVITTALIGVAACLGAFGAAIGVLTSGQSVSFHSALLLPLSGVDLTLDPLGAIFVAVTSLVGVASCIYYIGYARGESGSRLTMSMFMLFLFSLLLVPMSSSVMTWMFAWELMALSSMLLITTEHRHHTAARQAALWYGVMTQLGAASILLGFLIMAAPAHGQTFSLLELHASGLSSLERSAAFVLCLIGFSSKAGAVPLHVWLPKAHPEAPSPISALMSGSMVALGIYGIIRVGETLLGGGALWWWMVVSSLGVMSALFGALHATTSTDIKRLLAYSTIDVMGLVLLGVGAAGALAVTGHHEVAHLAMVAALLLIVAHSAFKGCLFLAAGAIERSTGTRNLDQLGGLLSRIPFTALLFAVATLSVMAIPLFSGFSSEWLLFEGLLGGFVSHNSATSIAMLVSVIALALTGGLTAIAFVKAFGIAFLGQPRSINAAEAMEVAPSMRVAMFILCVPSLVLGLAPGSVLPLLNRASNTGLHFHSSSPLARSTSLILLSSRGSMEPLLILGIALTTSLALWGVLAKIARRDVRRVASWSSGRDVLTPRMQYTATSFAEPLQRVFVDVLRPDNDLDVTHESESRYYEQHLAFLNRVDDTIESSIYQPLINAVRRAGTTALRVQNGSIHRYLALGFIALLVVLVVLA